MANREPLCKDDYYETKCNMAKQAPRHGSFSKRKDPSQSESYGMCDYQVLMLSWIPAFSARLSSSNKTNFLGIFDPFPCLFSEYGYI